MSAPRSTAAPTGSSGVGAILDQLDRAARDARKGPGSRGSEGEVSVGEVVERFGTQGFGPLLLLPALIEVSPIGGVPGLPTVLAAIVALVAVQLLFGREHLWLPGLVRRRAVRADGLSRAVGTLRPLARRLDRWFHGRLPLLVSGPFVRLGAVLVLLACLSVPFLELVPFASTIPMAVVIAFGLAMTVRDGLLMLLAFAGSLAGVLGVWWLLR